MEAQPIYGTEAYSLCQNQDCHCRTCGNDQNGECVVQEGNCGEAVMLNRCPVQKCPNWAERQQSEQPEKEVPHEQSN